MWLLRLRFSLAAMLILCSLFMDGQGEDEVNGLFPVVFNLATRARISANATCGEAGAEVFCKLVEHVRIFPAENRQCDICDARSGNPKQRHPITNAIDGSQKWWQSPTLTNGARYNYVTITLDLGQIYQIAYIIIKAANAPRPGNWILERSIDGITYMPWQYFAMSDKECEDAYRMHATVGVPSFLRDDEVICTSRYSALNPLEDGEIFVSLVNGRPGVFQPSKVLMDFTSARYVRLRFQKIRTLHADLMSFRSIDPKEVDASVTRRYYYSVKDISIGGQCICYGHASNCGRHDTLPDRLQCKCLHNTTGDNCEKCLPLFNQKPWQVGGIQNIGCEECNCHDKSDECVYNATVDALGLSLNKLGMYDGGGVCLNCKEYTTGINCEKCLPGYYRPAGMKPSMRFPCRPCNCRETQTSTSDCVTDDRRVNEGLNPGDCICKKGFTGPQCASCAPGYYGYPNCQLCHCHAAGSVHSSVCDRACICKTNVGGNRCDRCKQGFFNLDKINPDGCTQCFCFGVTRECDSVGWGLDKIENLEGWVLSTLQSSGLTLLPRRFNGWLEAKTYLLKIDPRSYSQDDIHYWMAPRIYLGNKLSSYGGHLLFTIKYILDDQMTSRYHLSEPNIVLEGSNISITPDRQYLRESIENVVRIHLHEDSWYHLRDRHPVTRNEMMTVLYSLQRLLIRATYHTAQDTVYLKDVQLDSATPLVMDGSSLASVEKCRCPEGYAGLSCESCSPGWRRVNNRLYEGVCQKCECYNHAMECDPVRGHCIDCKHNTMGEYCDRCLPGYYGDARQGTPDACKPCGCPLVSSSNFFAERCIGRPTVQNPDAYMCVNCIAGYTGTKCEMCASGYYGNPTTPGGSCRRCFCGGIVDTYEPRICNNITGACYACRGNTEGEFCERCQSGYYGSAMNGDCKPCECNESGSNSLQCHPDNGQCSCRERYTGHKCDRCQQGYGNIERGCDRCSCDRTGSESTDCDSVSGQCRCKPGVGGLSCDKCENGYYGFSWTGCRRCSCYSPGTSNGVDCDSQSGSCVCRSGVTGSQCDVCQSGYYGLELGKGCIPCDCSRIGSLGPSCDGRSGQCRCLDGVTGQLCDQCLPGYYGFSSTGCQRCEPCDKKGHVCDPVTGQCVCPPNTEGPNCEICITNGWGFDKNGGCKNGKQKNGKKKPNNGRNGKNGGKNGKNNGKRKNGNGKKPKNCKSKLCNCSVEGSESQQCHTLTGQCSCFKGYQGFSCDQCGYGFYNFPDCKECACNRSGVVDDTCDSCICECDGMGQCFCKKNVEGQKCDRCRAGTFGLSKDNPLGCTECYCFLRAQSCQQAPYVWSNIELPYQATSLVRSGNQGKPLLNRFDNLIINDSNSHVPDEYVHRPLYWKLPDLLPKDMVLSYNGKLQFVHYFESPPYSSNMLHEAPLVIIVGNGFQIQTDISSLEPNNPVPFEIPLHEDTWHLPGLSAPISRRIMMIVLQNVEAILIRAVQDGRATFAELGPISVQRAIPQSSNITATDVALGVELCHCPDRFSGESCQNPGPGYYRVIPPVTGIDLNNPETIIGYVRPCPCHGHSQICQSETGQCYSCQHNTTGDSCERCTDGFYGIATKGTADDCQPCACPLPIPSNNFSPSCVLSRTGMICTACQERYTGQRCESCAPGYHGRPQVIGSICRPCNCNPQGSRSQICDADSGQCYCLDGIGGLTCDACTDPDYGVENGVCVSCYTGCTGILLGDIAAISVTLLNVNFSDATYPWEKLFKIETEANELRNKLEGIQSAGMKDFVKLEKDVQRYNELANNLINRSRYACETELTTTGTEACKTKESTVELLKNATELEKIVRETFDDIKNLVEGLDDLVGRLIYNQSGINMTAALETAKKMLDEIISRNFSSADKAAKLENRLAEQLSERTRELGLANVNSTDVENKLNEMKRRLQDLMNQTGKASDTAAEALEKIKQLKDLLRKLTEIKDEIKKLHENSEDTLNEARDLLARADMNLAATIGNNEGLDIALDELARKVNDLRRALPRLTQLAMDAIKHALDLKVQADKLDDTKKQRQGSTNIEDNLHRKIHEAAELAIFQLFAGTRNLSENAVKAANAYKSIVDAINEAKKSANEALIAANASAEIAKVKDLRDEVLRLIRKSEAQDREATNLLNSARDLANNLSRVQNELNDAASNVKRGRDILDEIKRKLALLPSDIRTRLAELDTRNSDTEKTIRDALALVKRINNTELDSKMDEVTNLDIKAFNFEIGTEIARVKGFAEDIKQVLELERKVDDKTKVVNRKLADLSEDLERLRAKIRDAQSRVNDMKMSLQADGQCYRSYRSPLNPSSTNEIRFSFMLNHSVSDMLILLFQESPQEFIAAEIRNQEVHLSWNSGKGKGSVSHEEPLKLDTWYQVLARRVGSVGQLKVWSVEEGTEQSARQKAASMGAGCSLMNLNNGSTIFLAGSNDLYQIPSGITRQNFTGCLGDVFIDGNRLGAYNFKTNILEHCDACKEVPRVKIGASKVYVFGGRGFARFEVRQYSPQHTKVELEFKTFWEDSRIFFVGNAQKGDYLSIELKGGLVFVQFYLGGANTTHGHTNNTYNNNMWTKITFERRLLSGVLIVGTERVPLESTGTNNGLELAGAPMYFGGVPTTLKEESFKELNRSDFFYGCMRNIYFRTNPPDDDTSTLVNVQTSSSCRENGIHTVGFKGTGYLLLQNEHLDFADEKNDISLTFVTYREDAILFIARDIAAENYYSMSLSNGQLEAGVMAEGMEPQVIKSDTKFNDGNMHCASLIKDEGILELVVDDVVIGSTNIQRINFNKAGNLYLGGFPTAGSNVAAAVKHMDGCISDVIVNGVLLSMSDAIQYKRADVGRCHINNKEDFPVVAPRDDNEPKITTLLPASDTPAADDPHACASEKILEFEVDAKSVANSVTFFADITKVRTEDVARNFSFSFDFRTYYPDGLFGYLVNKDRSFYFGIQLHNRRLEVAYKHDEIPYSIVFTKALNDGRWHSVFVEKSGGRLTASYDKEVSKSNSIDEVLDIELPLHLGGPQLPENFTEYNIPLVNHSIRGCIRALKVNGRNINITDTQVIQDVSGCYKNVEPGAFFDGESWGAFGFDFVLEPRYTMSMDFRTTSQTGVLLSASTRFGYGFTLELDAGKIKLGLKNADGEFRSETTNENQFLFCDNKWHQVRASVFDGELSVSVDGEYKGTSKVGGIPARIITDYPLFIGGFPEKFLQPASLSADMFFGCIRNLSLNGTTVDWYALPNMKGIRKTACPIS